MHQTVVQLCNRKHKTWHCQRNLLLLWCMKTIRDSNSVRFYRLKVSYQNTLVVTASIIRKWIGWDSNWVPAPIKSKHQNERTTDPNGRSPLSLLLKISFVHGNGQIFVQGFELKTSLSSFLWSWINGGWVLSGKLNCAVNVSLLHFGTVLQPVDGNMLSLAVR